MLVVIVIFLCLQLNGVTRSGLGRSKRISKADAVSQLCDHFHSSLTDCWIDVYYAHMIQEFCLPTLNEMEVGDVWFQQDGATAHTAHVSMTILRQYFPGCLISLRGVLQWPARPPDLAPCDYFYGAI